MDLDIERYRVSGAESIITPSLLYYEDIIEKNTQKVIDIAGGADRLWPHVKTHKMAEMVKRQIALGIKRFKCATIAEAEMVAGSGASDVLVAYPLLGPNISRFLALKKMYPETHFWAIGDDINQLSLLAAASEKQGSTTRLLIDVNIGMDRTGVQIADAEEFFIKCSGLKGLKPMGLHCFSGNLKQPDFSERQETVDGPIRAVFAVRESLKSKGYDVSAILFGSTPSLPCYAKYEGIYITPGTAFVTDYGYYSQFKDLCFEPGAAILTTVISRAKTGLFTIDLGYKAISADPQGARGVILGYEDSAQPFFQCEEHWTFKMKEGEEDNAPEVGTLLYVIPTHICPTTALYPSALTVKDGAVSGKWEVTARNRKLTV